MIHRRYVPLEEVQIIRDENKEALGGLLPEIKCWDHGQKSSCPHAVFSEHGMKCIFADPPQDWIFLHCVCAAAIKAYLKKFLGLE